MGILLGQPNHERLVEEREKEAVGVWGGRGEEVRLKIIAAWH